VINKGVSGQASFEMLERFERDVAAHKPRAVIIWGFINDIFRADGDGSAAIQRARQTYARMIELARERGIEPIIATEVTMRPPASWTNTLASIVGAVRGKESYQARTNRQVIETNRWLADEARREGLLLLDFQSTLAEGGGMRRAEFTQEDGSHITPAGYSMLTSYAKPILEAHLARNVS
jgi:lysophospholipase L1-like esterase